MLSVLILYMRAQRFTKSQNLVQVYVVGGSVFPFCLLQYIENHTLWVHCFEAGEVFFSRKKNYTDCSP